MKSAMIKLLIYFTLHIEYPQTIYRHLFHDFMYLESSMVHTIFQNIFLFSGEKNKENNLWTLTVANSGLRLPRNIQVILAQVTYLFYIFIFILAVYLCLRGRGIWKCRAFVHPRYVVNALKFLVVDQLISNLHTSIILGISSLRSKLSKIRKKNCENGGHF